MSIASVLMLVLKRARGMIAAILVVGVLLGSATLLKAQDMEVPVTLHIPLFFKVMSFDRSFPARTGRSLVIAVVYQRGNRASIEARDEALRSIARTPRSADGVVRRGIAVDLDSESLAPRLIRESADVVAPTSALHKDHISRGDARPNSSYSRRAIGIAATLSFCASSPSITISFN